MRHSTDEAAVAEQRVTAPLQMNAPGFPEPACEKAERADQPRLHLREFSISVQGRRQTEKNSQGRGGLTTSRDVLPPAVAGGGGRLGRLGAGRRGNCGAEPTSGGGGTARAGRDGAVRKGNAGAGLEGVAGVEGSYSSATGIGTGRGGGARGGRRAVR